MVAIGALAMAGLAHAQTAAPSALGLFRAICVDTDARPAASLAAAPGWAELDGAMADRFGVLKLAFHDVLMRSRPVGTGTVVAFSGVDGKLPGVTFSAHNSACGLMTINTGADEGAIQARTAAWLGAKGPSYTVGPANIYTFTEKAGIKAVLTPADAAQANTAMAEGALKLVFVQSQGPQTLFFYLISAPVK